MLFLHSFLSLFIIYLLNISQTFLSLPISTMCKRFQITIISHVSHWYYIGNTLLTGFLAANSLFSTPISNNVWPLREWKNALEKQKLSVTGRQRTPGRTLNCFHFAAFSLFRAPRAGSPAPKVLCPFKSLRTSQPERLRRGLCPLLPVKHGCAIYSLCCVILSWEPGHQTP